MAEGVHKGLAGGAHRVAEGLAGGAHRVAEGVHRGIARLKLTERDGPSDSRDDASLEHGADVGLLSPEATLGAEEWESSSQAVTAAGSPRRRHRFTPPPDPTTGTEDGGLAGDEGPRASTNSLISLASQPSGSVSSKVHPLQALRNASGGASSSSLSAAPAAPVLGRSASIKSAFQSSSSRRMLRQSLSVVGDDPRARQERGEELQRMIDAELGSTSSSHAAAPPSRRVSASGELPAAGTPGGASRVMSPLGSNRGGTASDQSAERAMASLAAGTSVQLAVIGDGKEAAPPVRRGHGRNLSVVAELDAEQLHLSGAGGEGSRRVDGSTPRADLSPRGIDLEIGQPSSAHEDEWDVGKGGAQSIDRHKS